MQHCPHLPLNTDSIIADDLALRVAHKLGKHWPRLLFGRGVRTTTSACQALSHYGDLGGYMDRWEEEIRRLGVKPEKAGGHACLGETSEVLRLKPDAVRVDKIEPGFTGSIKGLRSKVFRDGVQVVTENGVIGDPRGSTPEIEEALLEKMSDHLAEFVRQEMRRHLNS